MSDKKALSESNQSRPPKPTRRSLLKGLYAGAAVAVVGVNNASTAFNGDAAAADLFQANVAIPQPSGYGEGKYGVGSYGAPTEQHQIFLPSFL